MRARKNDLLSLTDGRCIPPDILLKPIEIMNAMFGSIIYQFQAKQKDSHNIQVIVVMNQEFQESEFLQYYRNLLGEMWTAEMEFEFVFRNEIFPKKPTGKIGWFENESQPLLMN